jgi:ADP-heptose:LPS heptosyltransferase
MRLHINQKPLRPVNNILVIKPGAIGDLLQLTPVLRALKTHYPSSRITLITGSRASGLLFRNNPHVHDVLVYEKRGEHRQAASFLKLWADIRRRRFDLVLNFQRSNLKIWLLTAAAYPCRVLVYHRSDRPGLHAVKNYLETIEPLGIPAASPDLELFPGPEDRSFADAVLAGFKSDAKPLIALNPGASHAVNRWDMAQFAELQTSDGPSGG